MMEFQLFTFALFVTSRASAACNGGKGEYWDLQVLDGTAQCQKYNCYMACTFPDGRGSCHGCGDRISTGNVRPLGDSYCCESPLWLLGQNNPCVTGCPPGSQRG